MKSQEKFSQYLRRRGLTKVCRSFLVLGIFNLLFLPWMHFHPGNTHSHSGQIATHHHQGHLHSPELETVAHFFNAHPDDPATDAPLHHSHSSQEHDSDLAGHSILALNTAGKAPTLTTVDKYFSDLAPAVHLVGNSIPLREISTWHISVFDLSPPMRGPPTSI